MMDGSLLTLLRSVLDECRPKGTCLQFITFLKNNDSVLCNVDVFFFVIEVTDEALIVFVVLITMLFLLLLL